MPSEGLLQHFKATRPFGCLLAGLLGLGMGFVVMLGSVMGDCEPGPGCHDHDGTEILYGLFLTAVIVSGFGLAGWLVSALARMRLRPVISAPVTNAILTALIVLFAWACFEPAMELMFAIR
jgi:hypothetical protein